MAPAERATIGDVVTTWSSAWLRATYRRAGTVHRGRHPPATRGALAVCWRTGWIAGRHPGGIDVERLRDGRIAARVEVDPSGSGAAPPESLIAIVEQVKTGSGASTTFVPEGSVGAAGTADKIHLRHPGRCCGTRLRLVPACRPSSGSDCPDAWRRRCPHRNPARSGAGEEPEERWRTPTGWYSDAQPVVARGLVFFGGFSLGARTHSGGRRRGHGRSPLANYGACRLGGVSGRTGVGWRHPLRPGAGARGRSAGGRGRTGEPLWFAPFGFTSVTAPAVDADAVYVAGWGVRNTHDRTKNDASGASLRSISGPDASDGATWRRPALVLWQSARTPSLCRATAGSLPSIAPRDESAGRRDFHRTPEIRRPLPAKRSSWPATRSPRASRHLCARCRQRRPALASRSAARSGSPRGHRGRQRTRLRDLVGRTSDDPAKRRAHFARLRPGEWQGALGISRQRRQRTHDSESAPVRSPRRWSWGIKSSSG